MSEVVIKFDHVTKMYKLFKSDKKRLLHTFFKNISIYLKLNNYLTK